MMRTLIFSLLLCCLSSAFAQFPLQYIDSVYVVGGEPCPTDSVVIVSALVANTSALVDQGSSTLINGNNIVRSANYCQGFLQAFANVNDTVHLGILPQGTYTFTCEYATADAAFSCMSLNPRDTRTITFTVGPAVSAVTLPGDTSNLIGQTVPVCVGDSLVLTSNATASLSPQWFNNGIPIPGATDSTFTVVTPGAYALSVERCGARDTSDLITVVQSIPQVSLNLPTSKVCDNAASLSLSGGAPSGGSWSGPFVTGANFDAFSAPPGAYTITYAYIDSAGCPGSATANLTVAPVPQTNFSSLLPVCQFDPAFALNGGQPSGGVYSGPGVNNGLFDPSQAGPGIHILQYTFTNADSCSSTASSPITVNAAASQPTITQSGDTLFSSAPSGNQWYNAAGPLPGATGPWFIPTASGSYYVIANSIQGCNSAPSNTITVVITDLDRGISAAWDLHLQDRQFLVQGTPNTTAELSLLDLRGRVLLRTQVRTNAAGKAQRTTKPLAKGLYLMQLRTADAIIAQKIRVF